MRAFQESLNNRLGRAWPSKLALTSSHQPVLIPDEAAISQTGPEQRQRQPSTKLYGQQEGEVGKFHLTNLSFGLPIVHCNPLTNTGVYLFTAHHQSALITTNKTSSLETVSQTRLCHASPIHQRYLSSSRIFWDGITNTSLPRFNPSITERE